MDVLMGADFCGVDDGIEEICFTAGTVSASRCGGSSRPPQPAMRPGSKEASRRVERLGDEIGSVFDELVSSPRA